MKKQKHWYNRWWMIVIYVFIGLMIVNSLLPKTENNNDLSTTDNLANSNLPTWHEVISFSGNGIKNTETFTIPSKEWRISWETLPMHSEYLGSVDMNFQIYVYKEDETLKGVAANVIGADKDSSIMRGAGDYYLMINTAQPYYIVIEAKY